MSISVVLISTCAIIARTSFVNLLFLLLNKSNCFSFNRVKYCRASSAVGSSVTVSLVRISGIADPSGS